MSNPPTPYPEPGSVSVPSIEPVEWPDAIRDEAPPAPKRSWWRHAALFAATVVTTTLVGAEHYAGFLTDFSRRAVTASSAELLVGGLWYSVSLIAILGAHELGHYYACRYYDVDASPPYFLPAPGLFGTFGAFIRIREPIRYKSVLFDVGVAGPIAGFVVAVPLLFIGVALSPMVSLPALPLAGGAELGEPLLFKFASWLLWGPTPAGYSLNLHPVAFAAWFGLLATALNLFPIGQLDGGHISYAVLGARSTIVTLVTVGLALVLTFFSMSWLVWTLLMIVMLVSFGARHPHTIDERVPLDRTRLLIAFGALVMFALCFTPFPIEPYELIRPR